jgi:hypothetical protein
MPVPFAAAAVVLAAAALPATAQDTSIADACLEFTRAVAPESAAGPAFCDTVAALETRLNETEARAAGLQARLAETAPWVAPPGSILLVDDARGCPDGWTDVGEREPDVFAGRVPVAAGIGIPEEMPGYRSLGGSAAVTLEPSHLPPHRHDLPLAFARLSGTETGGASSGFMAGGARDRVAVPSRTGRETTERAGVGAPHENRPPFVGLYWCRRD